MSLRVWILFYLILNFVNAENFTKHSNNTILFDNVFISNIFNYDINYFKHIFELLEDNYENKKCHDDIAKTLNGFSNFEPWALSVLDATGKLGSGILRGNIKSLGHYDECVETDAPDFTGQYCLSTLHMHSHNKQWNKIINTMTLGAREREIPLDKENNQIPSYGPTLSHIHLGVCVPSSCTAQDVQMLLNSVLQNLTQNTPLEISAKIDHGNCYVNKSKPWTREDIYFITLAMIIIVIAVFASIYNKIRPPNLIEETQIQMLRSFSIPDNWNRLMNTKSSGSFTSLDGIRVMSTLWVILAHKLIMHAQDPWINKNEAFEKVRDITKMPMFNSMIPVETFFVTSAFLRSYNLLREYQNNSHDYISSAWKRYLRLTPGLVTMMGFYATLAPRLGSGPYWNEYINIDANSTCRTNWLINILYVNNYRYFNNGIMCMLQAWYLAADMQFFLVAPLLMYLVWRWPNKAKYIFFVSTLVAILIPFFYILKTSSLPIYLLGASTKANLEYREKLYFPTHQRSSPYIIGLALGFIMFTIKEQNIKLSKTAVATGWTLCMLMLYAVVFGPYKYMQIDYVYNVWEMALYGALHRPVWAIAVAWIVFACHLGYGGLINDFLSSKIFQPLSKLSYCMFLTHYLVLMVNAGKVRTAVYMSDLDLLMSFIIDVLVSALSAIVLHLLIEAPGLELIKLITFKGKGKQIKTTKVA